MPEREMIENPADGQCPSCGGVFTVGHNCVGGIKELLERECPSRPMGQPDTRLDEILAVLKEIRELLKNA